MKTLTSAPAAFRMLVHRRSTTTVGVVLLAAACAQLPRRDMQVIPDGAALTPMTPERSLFNVPLTLADGKGIGRAGTGLGSVTVSVRQDNSVLYSVEIDNAAGETFTQAQVVRTSTDGTVDVVATLFSEVMMRGRRISVRGTASLARSLPPDALLARVREHPGEYQVIVRGERHPVGTLSGALGASR